MYAHISQLGDQKLSKGISSHVYKCVCWVIYIGLSRNEYFKNIHQVSTYYLLLTFGMYNFIITCIQSLIKQHLFTLVTTVNFGLSLSIVFNQCVIGNDLKKKLVRKLLN